MRLKLEKRWTRELLQWPESGMGYQRADLRLTDGRELKDVAIFNAEEVEVPDEYAAGCIADIRIHTD